MHYAKSTLKKVMGARVEEAVVLTRRQVSGTIETRPHSENYIPKKVVDVLSKTYYPVLDVPGLKVAEGLVRNHHLIGAHQPLKPMIDAITYEGENGGIEPWEDPKALRFACDLHTQVQDTLEKALQQRHDDSAFIRNRTVELEAKTRAAKTPYNDPSRQTIIGEKDQNGRVIVGPLQTGDANYVEIPADFKVKTPAHLQGPHMTLFGPHQDPNMSRHAINAIAKKTGNPVLDTLIKESGIGPFWGADGEDSVIPDAHDNIVGQHTLKGAFKLRADILKKDPTAKPALPIKRIPGIAIPDPKHLYNGAPLPMHLLEFSAHLYTHQNNPEALSFYIPKLETEEEAAYLNMMIRTAEDMIQKTNPNYKIGTVKVIIVFETARATFRMKEIAYALKDYFVGGSLGWHDYLASAATLFEGVKDYQIPVKSDSNIVQNHIRTSHEQLASMMHDIGAIAIGGMFGFLPVKGKSEAETELSYSVTMKYYVKDVVAQLHRGLDGFWVAHPQFAHLGIALIEAYKRDQTSDKVGAPDSWLFKLLDSVFPGNPAIQTELKNFIQTVDQSTETLDPTDPAYPLALLAANLETSDVIANNDKKEVSYNIEQALEYLCSWFMGTGCVALETQLKGAYGEPVPVRVMDDLATTERSLRELWAELNWGRFNPMEFTALVNTIAAKNLQRRQAADIQQTQQNHKMEQLATQKRSAKLVQELADPTLKASDIPSEKLAEHDKWMRVAKHILELFVTQETPPKNITELLLLTTLTAVRNSPDPLSVLQRLTGDKYTLKRPATVRL